MLSVETEIKRFLDFGCSNHMTGRKDILKNLQPTGPYNIRLSNGTEVIAFEQGSVCLGPKFIIHNVFYLFES